MAWFLRFVAGSWNPLKPRSSFTVTAGSSSPMVVQVLSPRDWPCSCTLTNSPPPKTRARAKESRHERPSVYYVIEIIWLNLVFLSSRLDAVPAIQTLVIFAHIHILRPFLWTLTNSGNIYIYIRHIYVYQIANICIYSCDNIHRCIYISSTRLRPHKRTPSR